MFIILWQELCANSVQVRKQKRDYIFVIPYWYCDLAKLDIKQLYILAGLNREAITDVYRRLQTKNKPSLEKETYVVKIPTEKANEYSNYLSIAQAFNNLREAGNNHLNSSLLPQMTGNRIVLDSRSMKLMPNPYRFIQDYN